MCLSLAHCILFICCYSRLSLFVCIGLSLYFGVVIEIRNYYFVLLNLNSCYYFGHLETGMFIMFMSYACIFAGPLIRRYGHLLAAITRTSSCQMFKQSLCQFVALSTPSFLPQCSRVSLAFLDSWLNLVEPQTPASFLQNTRICSMTTQDKV